MIGGVTFDEGEQIVENEEELADEDDFNPDAEVQTICKEGDVWQLGEHRLMCGDSTKVEDVKKLMNGEMADLWLTDPPYNVAYEGKTKDKLTIQNDRMNDKQFEDFLFNAFTFAIDALKQGGAYYVWSPQGHNQVTITKTLDVIGVEFKQYIIWAKNSMVLGRQDYQWKHEPCFYGWKPGAAHFFRDVRTETTVIPDAKEINIDKMSKAEMQELLHKIYDSPIPTSVINENKPARSDLHPTMKPIKLFAKLICNSSRRGEIVLDTFGGSGTTMMACEQLGRKARLMELDPHYCDVIIARWEQLTGKTARKIE